ncbi:MAG TPA: pyridoxal-phosphate dependent enzyme [Gammaproteobacteria bacterium]|nr:pyridoxal-phosphate dependent enzyme [Gammaproteobacteria bacterium]
MDQTNTPVVALKAIDSNLYLKIEYLNPVNSIKFRAIPKLLLQKKQDGLLKSEQIISILSAGSAALTATWTGAQLGHKVLSLLPQVTPNQIIQAIKWLGGEVIVDTEDTLIKNIKKISQDSAYYVLSQSTEQNLINFYSPIGFEIVKQIKNLSAVTIGMGTGASLTGIGRAIKEKMPHVKIFGVEPSESAVASGNPWAPHKLIGLAPPIPQPLLDKNIITDIITVSSEAAWEQARNTAKLTGLTVGPIVGATILSALEIRKRGIKGNIVAIGSCSIYDYL